MFKMFLVLQFSTDFLYITQESSLGVLHFVDMENKVCIFSGYLISVQFQVALKSLLNANEKVAVIRFAWYSNTFLS